MQDVVGADVPSDLDGETLARELVNHGQQAQLTPVIDPGHHEVVRPHMAAMRRPQADAGPVSEPEAPPLRLAAGHLEPFLAPDPLHPLVVHAPALRPQQRGDTAVAVAPKVRGQPHDGGPEGGFCFGDHRAVPLRGPGLAQDLTRPTL